MRIEITEAEAETLLIILRRIGGNPHDSPRRHCDSVLRKLTFTPSGKWRVIPPSELRRQDAAPRYTLTDRAGGERNAGLHFRRPSDLAVNRDR